MKAKKQMLDKQTKKASSGKEAKDPERDFQDTIYRIDGGGYGFPSVSFKSAAVTAVTSVSGVTKVATRQAFHVVGEQAFVKGAFEGTLMRHDLVRIQGSEPCMREDMVRVGMGTADIRYRAEFWPWWVVLKVRFNENMLSPEQILNLFNHAGFGVGVGEWRTEKNGQYGSFHCAHEDEIEAIQKELKAA
jgi:hypothetical protein